MANHDASTGADDRLERDTRLSFAAAALATALRRVAGRVGGDYRTWDSGRRSVPDACLDKARELAAIEDPRRLWSLQELANRLDVHVRTLRDAARSGRLEVTYENRVVFRHPIPRATIAAGRAFIERYYKQSYSRFALKPRPPEQVHVPENYHAVLIGLRQRLQVTQAELAARVEAANKAVVYQWETRRRTPSAVFWKKVVALVKEEPLSQQRS